jgi:hypothetical protein
LFSTKLICVEFYPRTSPITIAGDRIARWARQFHAARQGPSPDMHAERSSRNLCLAGYTTFTALLHDKFLRPVDRLKGAKIWSVMRCACKCDVVHRRLGHAGPARRQGTARRTGPTCTLQRCGGDATEAIAPEGRCADAAARLGSRDSGDATSRATPRQPGDYGPPAA